MGSGLVERLDPVSWEGLPVSLKDFDPVLLQDFVAGLIENARVYLLCSIAIRQVRGVTVRERTCRPSDCGIRVHRAICEVSASSSSGLP